MAPKEINISPKVHNPQGDKPCDPAPTPTPTQNDCEETVTLTGTVTANCECCCPQLKTRLLSLHFDGTEAARRGYVSSTANAYGVAGYILLGIAVEDVGQGWDINLIIGWYV